MCLKKELFALSLVLSCIGTLSVEGSKASSTTIGVNTEKDSRLHHPAPPTSTLISTQYYPNNPFLYPKPPPTVPPYGHHQYPPAQYYPTQPPHYQTTEQPLYFSPTPTQHYYPTTPRPTSPQQQIIEQYDYRYPDGSYEFRYELPDETVRYERGYFIRIYHKRILVVRGYYSYRLPDKRYLTVFYTADHNGYRQDSLNFSYQRPQLPRSIQVDNALTRDALDSSEVEDTTLADEDTLQ